MLFFTFTDEEIWGWQRLNDFTIEKNKIFYLQAQSFITVLFPTHPSFFLFSYWELEEDIVLLKRKKSWS